MTSTASAGMPISVKTLVIPSMTEVSRIEGVNQEEADFVIDNYKNAITVCVYYHKVLHKHKDEFLYDASQGCFVSRDR